MEDYKKYENALARAKEELANDLWSENVREAIRLIFPELKESEDERIRKGIFKALSKKDARDVLFSQGVEISDALAWLKKKGEQSICKTPSREIILAIWDLGNEWKELTNGSISTEYGTQLDYIQKHWQESEYYLRAKQGEQKPAELVRGEDYGIDGLYAAVDILQKTLGKVEGYQTDDGILEHECAISAVKELSKHKTAWSEEDEDRITCGNTLLSMEH